MRFPSSPASRALASLSSGGSNGSAPGRVASQEYSEYSVESSTSWFGPCTSAQKTRIDDAVKFIRKNKSDIPTSCTKSMKNSAWHCFVDKGDCVGNPQDIVISKLKKSTFHVHCETSGGSCSKSGIMGYVVGCDTLDIHLCSELLDGSRSSEEIACVIVHEIMHNAGADEDAASAISNSLGWDCP